jgi:hypothetical protein
MKKRMSGNEPLREWVEVASGGDRSPFDRRSFSVSRRMQRTPGAVKQLLSRALDQLRNRFGDTASLGLPDRPLRSKEDDGD